MTRFIIDPGAAIRLVEQGIQLPNNHTLLAPTLLLSQILDILYSRVRNGNLTEEAGMEINGIFAKLKIRYLGDAVRHRRAWTLAAKAGMGSTSNAEYFALIQLQGDALIAGVRRQKQTGPNSPDAGSVR